MIPYSWRKVCKLWSYVIETSNKQLEAALELFCLMGQNIATMTLVIK